MIYEAGLKWKEFDEENKVKIFLKSDSLKMLSNVCFTRLVVDYHTKRLLKL